MGRVQGKVAIVTGGASGLGRASAQHLAREGAKVLITDVAVEGETVAQGLREEGREVFFLRQDVGAEEGWSAVMDEADARFGGLHILVNCAGIALRSSTIERESLADYRATMNVNIDGVYLGMKHAIAAMRRTGAGGSIINIASIFGIGGSAGSASYCASKGAVTTLTKSVALHCAKAGYGIRVNSIHPGFIETPMFEAVMRQGGSLEKGRERISAVTPLGHPGEPDDIAYGVLYLASDESKFVTGTALVIDGGYLAQ